MLAVRRARTGRNSRDNLPLVIATLYVGVIALRIVAIMPICGWWRSNRANIGRVGIIARISERSTVIAGIVIGIVIRPTPTVPRRSVGQPEAQTYAGGAPSAATAVPAGIAVAVSGMAVITPMSTIAISAAIPASAIWAA
jgi:hypothetical protein